MAIQSVSDTPIISGHKPSDPDTFERIVKRLEGLQAVATLAQMAMEDSHPTEKVLVPLMGLIDEVADDIHRDADLLRLEGFRRASDKAA